MSMMSVPRKLRDDIKEISSSGSFTVGLSNAGKVYVWGATQIGTTGINVAADPRGSPKHQDRHGCGGH